MPGELDREYVPNSATSNANAAISANINAAVGKRGYVTGIQVIVGGATAAGQIAVTLSGLTGGTKSWILNVPLGVNAQPTQFTEEFIPPLAANAVNTGISLTVPAPGAGNTQSSCELNGFRLPEP